MDSDGTAGHAGGEVAYKVRILVDSPFLKRLNN